MSRRTGWTGRTACFWQPACPPPPRAQTPPTHHAVPEHGQQGGAQEAACEILQVCVAQPLALRNRRDPGGAGVAFPVNAAYHASWQALQQPHQTALKSRGAISITPGDPGVAVRRRSYLPPAVVGGVVEGRHAAEEAAQLLLGGVSCSSLQGSSSVQAHHRY